MASPAWSAGKFKARAEEFCRTAPHRDLPYSRRNWGGVLHSLCSYQGKLKPAIAHFLISSFTRPGERVLDPMSGVGTIPLEARLQGRVGIAGDLSPLAAVVSRAKLEVTPQSLVWGRFAALEAELVKSRRVDWEEASFGLNGPISDYFHKETLREILLARAWFARLRSEERMTTADAVLMTGLLHILHGNRPYALSRRSHPVTPFAPSGPNEYRGVVERVRTRLGRVLPVLEELPANVQAGQALQSNFRDLHYEIAPVDAVITSPPFSSSLRFWSSNWMRLWFAGWSPEEFRTEPKKYLETEQRGTYEPYRDFASAVAAILKCRGTLIMHLGETAKDNMIDGVLPHLESTFDVHFVGRESVLDTESHGLRDKGATMAHWYIFATRR